MKKHNVFGTILLALFVSMGLIACSDDDEKGGETGNAKVIHVEEPGTLGSLLGNDRFTIEELVLTGDLDYEDQYLLGELSIEGSLRVIDLTNATLENDRIDNEIFYDARLESIKLPLSLTLIEDYAFGHCEHLRYVEFPATLSEVENNAFEACYKLTTLFLSNCPETEFDATEYNNNPNYGNHGWTTIHYGYKGTDGDYLKESNYAYHWPNN